MNWVANFEGSLLEWLTTGLFFINKPIGKGQCSRTVAWLKNKERLNESSEFRLGWLNQEQYP